MKWPILLFDFDGTLVSTEEIAQEAIHEYFDEKKVPNQAQFASLVIGRTWKAAAEGVFEEAKKQEIDLGDLTQMIQDWKQRYRDKIHHGVELIPGVIEKLEKLREKADFIGIVTGSDREEVNTILKHYAMDGFFHRIWSAGDYEFSKPHPAPFLKAMSDIGTTADQVLVFEDSEAGVESAFQAGVKWIQVLHGPYTKADPRSFKTIKDWNHFDLDWLIKN